MTWTERGLVAVVVAFVVLSVLGTKRMRDEDTRRYRARCAALFALAKTPTDSIAVMNGKWSCVPQGVER